MKAYVGTTGVVFAIVTLLHLARTGEILSRVSSDPGFVAGYALLTVGTAALAIWAWRVFRRLPPSSPPSP